MKTKMFITAALIGASLQTSAQTIATEYKGTSEGNPISGCVFCADPTALEYNGRLYVYGSNDHQQFIANGKKGENSYGEIKSIVVFSTADMVNWTFHGTIDTKKLCSGWVTSPWYQGYGVSWAPSVTWRTLADGTEEFFLYFCNSSHGIGVLTANSPIGPWKSPLKKLMIHRDTPGATPCSALFDPGVDIDENGVGWLSFGGLDPVDGGNGFDPKNARILKLNADMTGIDGDIVRIPAPYHFEANELNIVNGKFIYTYCSNWSQRTDEDWNAYKAEHNVTASKPEMCTMCYMVSDNPTDPNSWKYKGVYGPHPGMGTNNNHSHLQKFKGEYYYLYHGAPLMEKMRSAGVIDNNCGIFRSLCVNKATVSETTATVSKVTPNLEGVDPIGTLNPYELQEAETMATCGGIEYEDFTNISKNGRISSLGNDASRNMQVKIKAGSWTQLRKVDFGTDGASSLMLRAKGEGTVEFRLGRKGVRASATFNISSTDMSDYTIDVDPSVFKGVKTIYIVVSSGDDVYLDAWQATELQTNAIKGIENGKAADSKSFDLSGRRVSNANQHNGIVIEQYSDENGVKHSRKKKN